MTFVLSILLVSVFMVAVSRWEPRRPRRVRARRR